MAMQPTAAEANVRELSTAERVGAALALSASDTASFARSIAAIPDPALEPPPRAPRSAARALFDLFDADGSGAIELAEVGIALRFLGLYTDEKSAAYVFNEVDVDGSGFIEAREFSALVERVHQLRAGRSPTDGARLLATASALQAEASSAPLQLIAAGDLPALLRCAASGHPPVVGLALSALVHVASASVDGARQIAGAPELGTALGPLGKPDAPRACVREAARLLAALLQDATCASDLAATSRRRHVLFDLASTLLVAWASADGARLGGIEPSCAVILGGLSAEPDPAPRLGLAGGALLGLACRLADALDAETYAHAVGAIAACAASDDDFGWRLVGFGALGPLLRAAAVPATAEAATRALKALRYREHYRGVRGVDPLVADIS